MATSVAFKRGITAVTPFSKLFAPIRSVSALPCVPRWFYTDSSRSFAYDDLNRSVDADRRPDSTHFRKLSAPIVSVSAVPCVSRWFNTDSSHAFAYDVVDRSVDADRRRPDSTVSRRRDIDDEDEDDVFSDLFDPFMSTSRGGGGLSPRDAWAANENEERLRLRFDMPGLVKEKVKISIEGNTLIIKAEEEKESDDDDEPPRSFSQRIDLQMDVYKLEEIKAEMKNGVLKIRVPKVKMEERKDVRQIQVD